MCTKHLFQPSQKDKNVPHACRRCTETKHQTVPLKWWQRGRSISLMHGVPCHGARSLVRFSGPATGRPPRWTKRLGFTTWSISLPVPGGVPGVASLADRQRWLFVEVHPPKRRRQWVINRRADAGRRVDWWYSFVVMIRHPPPALSWPLVFDRRSFFLVCQQSVDAYRNFTSTGRKIVGCRCLFAFTKEQQRLVCWKRTDICF